MDGGAWWAAVHGVTKSQRLHFHFSLSCIGEGNGNPLQCSCLENPRDGGAWWAAVYVVTQSWTRLKRLSSSSSSSNGGRCHDLSVFNINLKPALSLSSFTLIKRLFSSSAVRVVSSAYLRLLMFPSPILILWAENSLDVSNFPVEISHLSPFVVFFNC